MSNSRVDIMGVSQKCDYCGRGLRCFRGRTADWGKRKMHKTCWKSWIVLQEIKESMKRQEEAQAKYDARYEEWRREGDERMERIRKLQSENASLKDWIQRT